MYPVFYTQATPSREVLTAERQIVAEEGYLTVRSFQYSTFADADRARRTEAEYRVREADRMAHL
ncbi:MAG: hypothetical protein ACR2KM_04230 [Gemmatimonadaceae bacterium]